MGGVVGITIITEDGVMHKMNRWTNTFPGFVNHLKFAHKDKEHLANFLAPWLEMKKDWEENRSTGQFKYEMTDTYFPDFGMAPVEYGLIVIDMVQNKIYSQQDYSTPGRAQRNLKRLEEFRDIPDYFDEEELEKISILQEFEKQNRLKILNESSDGYQSLQLDLAPFEVIRFEENKEASIQYMNLLDVQYSLNEVEKAQWAKFIEEQYEE